MPPGCLPGRRLGAHASGPCRRPGCSVLDPTVRPRSGPEDVAVRPCRSTALDVPPTTCSKSRDSRPFMRRPVGFALRRVLGSGCPSTRCDPQPGGEDVVGCVHIHIGVGPRTPAFVTEEEVVVAELSAPPEVWIAAWAHPERAALAWRWATVSGVELSINLRPSGQTLGSVGSLPLMPAPLSTPYRPLWSSARWRRPRSTSRLASRGR